MPCAFELIFHHRPAGKFLNDLFIFDPAALAWAELSDVAHGTPPAPRYGHSVQAAGDGSIYVFGGQSAAGPWRVEKE